MLISVERGVRDEGGVEDVREEEGVGEDSSDDPNYEASGDEYLSEYETTDAGRGKNIGDMGYS